MVPAKNKSKAIEEFNGMILSYLRRIRIMLLQCGYRFKLLWRRESDDDDDGTVMFFSIITQRVHSVVATVTGTGPDILLMRGSVWLFEQKTPNLSCTCTACQHATASAQAPKGLPSENPSKRERVDRTQCVDSVGPRRAAHQRQRHRPEVAGHSPATLAHIDYM